MVTQHPTSCICYPLTDQRADFDDAVLFLSNPGLAGIFGATKVLELAFAPNGQLKIGEHEPGLIENPAIELDLLDKGSNSSDATTKMDVDDPNIHDKIHIRRGEGKTPSEVVQEHFSRSNPITSGFLDAAETLANLRGIGWQFGTGTGVYVPQDWRDTSSRWEFARQTLVSWLMYFTMFDLLTSLLKLVPGIGTTAGGSIFAFGGDSLLAKYAISTSIEFTTGVAFILGKFCSLERLAIDSAG